MKQLICTVFLVLVAGCADTCESENIGACRRACLDNMLLYNRKEGCICRNFERDAGESEAK